MLQLLHVSFIACLICILHFSLSEENQFAFTLDIYRGPRPGASVAHGSQHWLVQCLLPAEPESKQAFSEGMWKLLLWRRVCVGK